MSAVLEVVERQFEAYNARDLARFLTCFADDVRAYRPPAPEPAIVGKRELANFYETQRFNRPGLRAELLTRMVLGNKVFDHERIWGIQDDPIEMVAVFRVQDGMIDTTWAFSPG
jgi:hypothetical protein